MADDFYHRTREGKRIRLQDMDDQHLANAIRLIESRAKEGIILRCGGGVDFDNFWYDEEELHGEEALSVMHYDRYVEEQLRRMTTCPAPTP
jgi:hypothetical protein